MTEREFYEKIGGNYDDALSRLMNDTLIRKFVTKFASDPNFDGLEGAVNAENWDDAFRFAHTLKGVALNLAFSRLASSVTVLTDVLRAQNRDALKKETVFDLFAKVKEDYSGLIIAIKEL